MLDFSANLFLTLSCDMGGDVVHKTCVTTFWGYIHSKYQWLKFVQFADSWFAVCQCFESFFNFKLSMQISKENCKRNCNIRFLFICGSFTWIRYETTLHRVDVPFIATLSISVAYVYLNTSFIYHPFQRSNINQYHLKGIGNEIIIHGNSFHMWVIKEAWNIHH